MGDQALADARTAPASQRDPSRSPEWSTPKRWPIPPRHAVNTGREEKPEEVERHLVENLESLDGGRAM